MQRRLITYLLIDTSGSMLGEPIEAVNSGLTALIAALRQNPYALETVHLNITTFDSEIKTVLPTTPLEQVNLPTIVCPKSGATLLGEALKHIANTVANEVKKNSANQKGDWSPMLIILTDGKPTDLLEFQEAIPLIKKANFSVVLACAAGPKADGESLKKLTDKVFSLDTMDGKSFEKFFEWVSQAVSGSSQNVGSPNNSISLPPPPPEMNPFL